MLSPLLNGRTARPSLRDGSPLLLSGAAREIGPAPARLKLGHENGVSVTTQYGVALRSFQLPVQALEGRPRQVCQMVGTELPAT